MNEEYFCTKCNKLHANTYNVHKKYADMESHDKEGGPITQEEFDKEIDNWAKTEPIAFVNGHHIAAISIRLDKIESDIKTIKKYMDLWSWEIQRLERISGFKRDKEFLKWVESDLDSGTTDFTKEGIQ